MMSIQSLLYGCLLVGALWQPAASVFHDDFNIPVTVQVPSGNENDTLRLHLAAYGAVPYGEVLAGVRVLHYPRTCMCGAKRCNTGCANLNLAPAHCRRKLRDNEQNVFVVEETGGDVDDGCSRPERAYNVAKEGAQALIIVADPNATSYLAAVDSQDTAAAVETLQFLEHVDMPIGIMNYTQGQRLKTYVRDAEKAGSVPQIKMDFSHEETGGRVNINVWHDTDDNCGVLCHDVHVFLADLADLAQKFVPSNPISIVPRYLFQTCTGDDTGSERCQKGCINNGKYCTLRGSRSARAPGAMIAQENVRQACLFDALKSNENNVREFWNYKRLFQANCKSADGTFTVKCSEEQFRKLTLAQADVALGNWNNCTSTINNGALSIPVADAEISGKETQKVADFQQATVVTAVSGSAKSHHFKGDLDAEHVIKAGCSALVESERSKLAICQRLSKGLCRPGGAGDTACKSQANVAKFSTKCAEVDTRLGYQCECDPGYTMISNIDGEHICENRNECAEFPSLCGRFVNERNACKDTPGSFECIEDLEQQCSAEKRWGGCWTGEVDGIRYHSCQDLVGSARFNLQEGKAIGALSQCNCENIKACWTGGSGECRERCPLDKCDVETGQCDGPAPLSTGGILGVIFAGVIAVVVAAALVLYIMRRRQRANDPAKGVVSSYNNFRDGMDADEMARSGTVEMYVAGASANSGSTYGSGKIPPGMVMPPPNGHSNGERPPTFAAQNSFVGSLTIEETDQTQPPPQS
eukprot:jgi/Ulvmu1/638/UM010_0008.1